MDSLDVVEIVMMFAEVSDDEAEHCVSPSEIVDSLERRLSNQRPNKQAASMLRELAKEQQRLELAEGLDGAWGRDQIAAIVRRFLR